MEQIIDPVDVELLLAELTPDKKLCDTNKGGNEIYIINAHNAPNTMREIGRLREISFRLEGGCSGKSMDIDEFDTMEKPYQQIIVWDPDEKKIAGGYRYILGTDVVIREDGQPHLSSAHIFRFYPKFIKEYLPYTIELGRSFVIPDYQSSKTGAKSIFILDNLWDGIAGVFMRHPNIMYAFGKPTLHPSYDSKGFALIDAFLRKHCWDQENLVRPMNMIETGLDPEFVKLVLDEDDYKKDFRNLKGAILKMGTYFPPLINSYINLTPQLKYFGGCYNDELNNAIEIGFAICFTEIEKDKFERHYIPYMSRLAHLLGHRKTMHIFPTREDIQTWATQRKLSKKLKLYKKIRHSE